MTEIDSVATALLEESKRFLEKAQDAQQSIAQHAYLHASLNLGFSALEAHVNAIVDEQLERTDLSIHERAFLSERKIELRAGEFIMLEGLQMQRIDDRIAFLWTKCSANPPFDYRSSSWSQLKEGLKLRNALTHPKEEIDLTVDKVTRTLGAILETIDAAFQRIYGKSLPARNRGLQSTLNF